jgi:hypothetical protein
MRSLIVAILVIISSILLTAVSSADPSSGAFEERFGLPSSPEKVLEEVLSREEFRKSPAQELWERILERADEIVRALLRRLAESLSGLGSSDSDLDVLWTIAASVLIGCAVVLFTYALLKIFRYLLDLNSSTSRESYDVPGPEKGSLGLDQLLERARAAAAGGNYGEAVIRLFRYVLLRLDEGGRVALHPGRTAREILNGMSADDAARPTLGKMVPIFNRVRYGKRVCTKAEFDRFTDLVARITGRN